MKPSDAFTVMKKVSKVDSKVNRGFHQAILTATREVEKSTQRVEGVLGDEGANVSPEEKKRTLRVRRGAAAIMQTIAHLVASYGLDSSTLRSDEMMSLVQSVAALEPLEAAVTRLHKRVSDERFVQNARAWDTALQFYALLQRRANTDAQLAAALSPVSEFFAYRHGSTRDGKPTKLQRRAQAKLAHAAGVLARANRRAGVTTSTPAAIGEPPSPAAVDPPPPPAAAPPAKADGGAGAPAATNGAPS